MTFKNDCLELFGTDNLYQIMNLERTSKAANIKKAYYQLSILWHPDRFSSSQHDEIAKELAKKKFQVIGRAYSVLSDTEKRKIYDQSGLCDDENDCFDGQKDWSAVWREVFKKVTAEEIEAYLAKFRGSKEEMDEIKAAYVKYKGDMDKIFETVVGIEVLKDEDRIREIIRFFIERGEVPAYPQFTSETARKRAKRVRKARAEEKEAEQMLKEMRERKGKKEAAEADLPGGSGDHLRSMILSKQRERADQQEDFLSHLEKKYGSGEPSKKKGRKGAK